MSTLYSAHILGPGDHASRPPTTGLPDHATYSCTEHGIIYLNDGGTWVTWAALGGGLIGTGLDQSGTDANAGGVDSVATGSASFAAGDEVTASGDGAHAEGRLTVASGTYSHAEGLETEAPGDVAHAEGEATRADGPHSHAEGRKAHTFRSGEHATAAQGNKTLQYSRAVLAQASGAPNDFDIGITTGPIRIPVQDGNFEGKLILFSNNMADRWDITFRGNNNAANYAGRGSGTVTIAASAGGGAPVYGASGITWTVTGTSVGDVEITPSGSISSRYAFVELFELHATI